jgi:hypothetical protein
MINTHTHTAPGDLLRTAPEYKEQELRGANAPRTHEEAMQTGRDCEEHIGFKKDHPKKATGIKGRSPLGNVPLFDLIWDILPDMMHILEGFHKTHLLKFLKGKRKAARPRRPAKFPDKESERAYKKLLADYEAVMAHIDTWILSEKELKLLDVRSDSMGGIPGWIRSSMLVNQRTGSLNAHDWLKLVESSYERYVFKDLLDHSQQNALFHLFDAFRLCLRATGDAIENAPREISALKLRVVEALCEWTREAPRTEHPSVLHILLHVPDAIFRWGSPRNYWAFFGERCAHFQIRRLLCKKTSFVHI